MQNFDEAFLRRLERLALAAARTPAAGLGGERISRRQSPSSTFSDHRPYTPGDDLRYVDWNAYARREQIFVKLGEETQQIAVHLLVDCSPSMNWGDPNKLAWSARLAAALGYLALAVGDRVSLAVIGDRMAPVFGPVHGRARAAGLVKQASSLAPLPGADLPAGLLSLARSDLRGGLVVLISDLLASTGVEEALRAFVPPRWQLLAMHVLDLGELRPKMEGGMDLRDTESAGRMLIDVDRETLGRYRANIHGWCAGLERLCVNRGASYVRLTTDMTLEAAVIPFLQKRRVLE